MNLTYATVPCCLMFLFPNPFAAAASAAENEDDDLKYLSYAVVTACSFIYDDSMSQTGYGHGAHVTCHTHCSQCRKNVATAKSVRPTSRSRT